jgi:non-lysosomal glucosylceramidase
MTLLIDWPVLTRYDQDHLAKIALPLGGIGTGTVSLGGRGDLRDWEVVNRPAKGFVPSRTFFALYARPHGGEAITRCLEGPVDLSAYEGGFGSPAHNHGLPRFRQTSFEAAYPFGQVLLSDSDVPVTVRLQAFNPLIPGDADRSSIPAAILRFVVTSTSEQPLTVSICGSLENFIGNDGTAALAKQNVNVYRRRDGLSGLFLRSDGVAPTAEQWGTMALATTAAKGISYRTAWPNLSWGDSLLDFWDDFSEDGILEEREAVGDTPTASLAVSLELLPGETQAVTFLLTWHFPNRMTWTPTGPSAEGDSCCTDGECGDPNWVGNYYATQYRDAWEAAARTAASLPTLEADTLAFVSAFCASDLPLVVKEAALYNLSTLRSQTSFRIADGHFLGWEGCGDKSGCCEGSCTHVWNYEQATAFLFGDLSRSMRDVEFCYATRSSGFMSFRASLPLSRASEKEIAAADGQMGCLLKLYRDWQLFGDDAWLRALWPQARKTLEFCWIPGGWDADQDGVMEGCQHNTMDVEYFGPNPQMQGWYLGALRATEEMARHLGDTEFADTCRALYASGRNWTDAHLFNGDYYEHEIRPIPNETDIAPGLRVGMGAGNLSDPELQLGSGCLVDQLVGQYMAEVCGLGALLDPAQVKRTLESLMRWNFQKDLSSHFNHMRTFALGNEAAMLMATYPKGRRPKRPFPYCNEVMTGFEYTAAVHMLYIGMIEEGLTVIEAIRARYDGLKRSPFDEAECGHHYARAMASWAAVLALTGFHYSAVTNALHFAASPNPCYWFWSHGAGWGTCEQTHQADQISVTLTVGHGSLHFQTLSLTGFETLRLPQVQTLAAGEALTFILKETNEQLEQ